LPVVVIPGLDPGIPADSVICGDPRIKSGDDEYESGDDEYESGDNEYEKF
jgi:hypothetical protein